MDARRNAILHRALALVQFGTLLCVGFAAQAAHAASYRTQHFLVTAPTADYAREVGDTAERLRRELAQQWLGRELPPWRDICPIEVMPIEGADGVTQFYFDRGQPYGWSMQVQGSRARVLDSVLPHEITHTIFATHFGRPLPRWADEGACTTTEDISERRKQEKLLVDFLRNNRGIPFNRMFEMTEYPADVLPLYAQGYSLARFLIAQKGRRTFINFVGDGLKTKQWGRAIASHYGYSDLSELQVQWNRWVAKGGQEQIAMQFGPASAQPAADAVAAAPAPAAPVAAGPVAPVTGPHFDALVSAQSGLTPLPGVAPPTAPAARPKVPATQPLTAQAAHQPGWYARRRDEHRQSHPHLMAERAAQPPDRAFIARPGASRPGASRSTAGASAANPTHVSRPQPPQPAQQVIVEWSRSDASAPVYR